MNIRKHRGMLAVAVMAVIFSMLFVSCSEPQNEVPGSATLTVRVADMTNAKTITPSGNVDVSHYKITVDNEAEDVHVTSDYLAKGESFTVTNIPAGLWTATVDAYVKNGTTGSDADYIKVATATSAETRVTAGESATLTVTLDTLDDLLSGDITVTLKMPSELDDENDVFWYTYSIQGTGQRDGVSIEHTTREQGTVGTEGLATISITDELMQGSYLLTVNIYDSVDEGATNVVRTGVDIMRLLPGLEATGQINLDSQLINEEGFKVQITDKVGDILIPEIIDGTDTYEIDATDSETEFTVTLSEAVPDGFVMEWYVDGVLADTTTTDNTSYTLMLEKGKHSVVGIMRDDAMLMSVGSVSFDVNVKAVINIEKESIFTFELNEDGASYTLTGVKTEALPITDGLNIPAYYNGLPVTEIGELAFQSEKTKSTYFEAYKTVLFAVAKDMGNYNGNDIEEAYSLIVDSYKKLIETDPEVAASIGLTLDNAEDLIDETLFSEAMSTIIESEALQPLEIAGDVYIPETVTSIKSGAFLFCPSVSSVKITETSQLESIGYWAFMGCLSLSDFNIPKSLVSIESSAFSDCSLLTSINIPDGVTSIGERAFYNCSALTTVEFSDTSQLESIGNSAFDSCSALENINIPSSVTEIAGAAFSGCSALTSINIPEGVTTISGSTFYGCTNLSEVILPSTLETIEGACSLLDGAFASCTSLESIVLPDGLASIGSAAFHGCSALANIIIPDSVISIGERVFEDCSSITTIEISDSSQLETIGDYAFDGCSALTNISIPNSVPAIGNSVFSDCIALTSIIIPDSVISIGEWAFHECSTLETVEISENSQLESIGDRAFQYCYSLESIIIPDGVTFIGDYTFYDCSSLTDIYCEAASNSEGWSTKWYGGDCPATVHWGYTGA